jgi:hypothetical protein
MPANGGDEKTTLRIMGPEKRDHAPLLNFSGFSRNKS